MARKLLESVRRRADFNPESPMHLPIRLSDGQEWFFPRPMVELRLWFAGDIRLRVYGEDDPDRPQVGIRGRWLTCGDALDKLLEMIAAAEDPLDHIRLVFLLGALMLKENYDLTNEELEQLFVPRINDPDTAAILSAIVGVATGRLYDVVGIKALSHPKEFAAGLVSV